MSPPRRPGALPPWVIAPLLGPYGLAAGYSLVAVVFLLSRAGVSTAAIAGFAALVILPQNVKVLWAPLIDATLGPKRWYVIGLAATMATLVGMGMIPATPAHLPLLTVLALANGVSTTVVSLPTEIITAYDVADDRKGRAAGWYQAANLGAGAIGGGLAILIAQSGAPAVLPAFALAAMCGVCGLALLMVAPRPAATSAANGITGPRALLRDLVDLLRSRRGILAVVLVLLPIGSGGLLNLEPAVAKDWRAGAGAVLIVSGIVGGLLQIVGALVGGVLSDRANRKLAYCAGGLAMAAVTLAMMAGPRTPTAFVVFGLAYNLVAGFSYACFSAVVLEAIGRGAAATKFTLMICLSNLPIQAVGLIDGGVHDRFGVGAMLLAESLLGVGGVAIFAGLAWIVGRYADRRAVEITVTGVPVPTSAPPPRATPR